MQLVSKRERLYAVIPRGLESWVANRTINAHFRIVPALLLGHMLNAVLICVVFYGSVATPVLAVWLGVMAAICAHRLYLKQKCGRNIEDALKLMRFLDFNSAAMAMVPALALNWLLPGGTATEQVFLAILGTSLIGAAAFTMRTLPRGALAYIAIVTTGMVIALLRTTTLEALAACVLLISSGILFARMALMAHRLFVVRIVKERDATNSAETVRMLLNDYEDQGSDWLFELDGEGRVVGASTRFASVLGKAPAELNGNPFASLFRATPETGQLVDHIAQRRAFRSLVLPVASEDGAGHWWAVSARPCGGADSIVQYRGVISDISSEKQAEERVRHMAHYDSLTGLPNRLMFTSALNRMVADRNEATRLAVLLIDIDHFKAVNDMYGHPVGDAFLRAVAVRIGETAGAIGMGGEGYIIARLGGDEFAILTGGADAVDQSIRLAERLVEAFAAPFQVDAHEIVSSVSIGIALAPDHAATAQGLQSNADIALYVAKDGGRGRWEMFEPGMDTAVQERHALARDLRHALARDEMRLFLQPLVNVETGTEVGFEALARWENGSRGMVMPNDFIPIAEETGLIVPIGEWVIRTALAEAARWPEPLSIAVNLSPVQLRSNNLVPTIMHALAETGIDPARVEFEITESVLMNDCEANIAVLNRLHALGTKIALDDFGTGYASLNYLLTFPFDKIKIDRSFISDLESREDCRAIVGAVIGLASQLGMCTLAEGVEHEAQLVRLRQQGCEMVQGWLFGKALPASDIPALRRSKPSRGRRRAA